MEKRAQRDWKPSAHTIKWTGTTRFRMVQSLDGDVAVVTGGASGNGRAIARKLAEAGSDIVIADIRREPRQSGRPTDELIEAETESAATFVEADVSDPDDAEGIIDAAIEYGSLDILVNNAGILGPQKPVTDYSESEYRHVMGVNLDGVYYVTQAAIPAMIESDGGSIVNLSSAAGMVGFPNAAIYAAAKGAVRLFTYSLAAELGSEGIRVNAIHPGIIRTAMTADDMGLFESDTADHLLENIPLGRFGDPEDVANLVLFLASDRADYISGESINLDGGEMNTV